jgi:transcriptional regulator with XRE-family HTH domain
MPYFGEWLAKRRADFGLTLRDLSEALGVPALRISRWERGFEDPPYEVRDACWDAMKRDGELPPIDPAPFLVKRENPQAAVEYKPPRRRTGPRTWLEEWADRKGTKLEDVLRAFGLSPTLKYHWRNGKKPSPSTQWKIARFLEIPEETLRDQGWAPEARDAEAGEATAG